MVIERAPMQQSRLKDTFALLSLLARPAKTRARAVYELLSTRNTMAEHSLYLNLGYWVEATTYDGACQELADLLAQAAGLGAGDEVLDVGFGFADADLFWMERYAPARIVGLNITPMQVQVARRRVAERGWQDRIDLQEGSATRMSFAEAHFDKVMALECCFHFDTREDFFREAFRVLRPGGRLAVADILPLPVPNKSLFVRLGEYLGRAFWQIPAVNLYPKEDYLVKLATAGFENVRVRSIREQVFEPFARYARGRLQEPEIKQRMHPLVRAFWGSSVRDAGAFDSVDYIIATADKGRR